MRTSLRGVRALAQRWLRRGLKYLRPKPSIGLPGIAPPALQDRSTTPKKEDGKAAPPTRTEGGSGNTQQEQGQPPLYMA